MTAPPVGNSQTLEDMEQSLATPPEKPKLADLKLEGDDVPADLRGKSVDELVKLADGLGKSLKLSEQARLAMPLHAPPPPVVPTPEEPELTDEALAELMQSEPIKAIRIMQKQAEKVVMKNLESRIGPLVSGTASAVENGARAKYPEEFEVLGSEISAMVQRLPNKAVLSDPGAWDDLVSFVRGQPASFDKLMNHRIAKKSNAGLDQARAQQADAAGMTFAPTLSTPQGGGPVVMDDYTKEIARNLNMSPEDYVKWSKV